ncbi:hypothetical protein MOK15_19325 [Sphingobium sp. BYY-5]|uniref:hypothetical protein n=1 Tax=Sphingobium sp. BYY-5 TaxID=2926400 RepID=UPI001FA7B06F|nr:hypothetical protein [Sphingobium sp. BYY-5]MCI4592235.1 hypothetical protein [Sphingobium sp. BYY-5]
MEILTPLIITLPAIDLPSHAEVLAMEDATINLGGRRLGPWTFTIHGPERVAIDGANGAPLRRATLQNPPDSIKAIDMIILLMPSIGTHGWTQIGATTDPSDRARLPMATLRCCAIVPADHPILPLQRLAGRPKEGA